MTQDNRTVPLSSHDISTLDGFPVATARTGLSLPATLPLDLWRKLGQQICTVSSSSCWWLGDWLIYGQQTYPDRYRQAITESSLDYQTLRNYAWVARKFPSARRRSMLSFQHHMEVAALSMDDQDHWLDFAERLKWSKAELRRQIKNSSSEDGEHGSITAVVCLQLDVKRDVAERLEAIAKAENRTLADWITSVLEAAAGRLCVTRSTGQGDR